jgi:hypothetical protein
LAIYHLTIKDIAMSQSSLFTVAATPALGAATAWKEKGASPNNAAACHIKLRHEDELQCVTAVRTGNR